ncbi:hypothetical protein LWI29_012748 [Acer saccharum]|uniref:Peptidase A1 domain-containing protein n=1 Tax=Acer saccharum TaxID=4024 RepID=A0AA39SXP0_ACESA|nr:hypothetical protein LWI29_012748 [Acer saccharum]
MASSSSSSSLHLFFLFLITIVSAFICVSSNAFKQTKPNAFIFPVKKNDTTHQFYTTLDMGKPSNYMNMVIDLGGQFSWLDCNQYNISSTYRPIRCMSAKCNATTEGFTCMDCLDGPPRPGCTRDTCAFSSYNPETEMSIFGVVGEDTIRVSSTDGRFSLLDFDIRHFSFACGDIDFSSVFDKGSASQGILGLGRASNTSVATQLSSAFKHVHNKFALCLPSSKQFYFGSIFVGGGPYYFLPHYPDDASKLLIKTPLIVTNPPNNYHPPLSRTDVSSQDYFIDVKGIKIDGKQVSFDTSLLWLNGEGFVETVISTVNYYTVLHSAIYKALVRDFVKEAATNKKMKRVGSFPPFGACFSSENIKNTMTGPAVPIIDLVVKGNNVPWRIYGANSMVKVKKNVLCLGFVDGGSFPITSIILGGHLLENSLLEFDLESSMVGFSSSLLFHNASCSQSRVF